MAGVAGLGLGLGGCWDKNLQAGPSWLWAGISSHTFSETNENAILKAKFTQFLFILLLWV